MDVNMRGRSESIELVEGLQFDHDRFVEGPTFKAHRMREEFEEPTSSRWYSESLISEADALQYSHDITVFGMGS